MPPARKLKRMPEITIALDIKTFEAFRFFRRDKSGFVDC